MTIISSKRDRSVDEAEALHRLVADRPQLLVDRAVGKPFALPELDGCVEHRARNVGVLRDLRHGDLRGREPEIGIVDDRGLRRGGGLDEGPHELRVRLEQLVADDHPRPGQRRDLVDREQVDAHPPVLELERLVVAEAGDQVDVAVGEAIDLVELRVLADGDVVGRQAAGVEQRQQRVPRRAELAGRADAHPGEVRRIGRHRPRLADQRHREALVERRDVANRDPGSARDHHVGGIGHAELGLAVGDEALDVGRLAMLDRHLEAGIGVEALLLRDVERRELHVRAEPEEQGHRTQRLSRPMPCRSDPERGTRPATRRRG